MRGLRCVSSAVLAAAASGALAAPASAEEKLLTLYSPKFESLPYVHRTHTVALRPNGREAPAEPGYILGFKEQALVDSKDPDAKPLPINKMMVHHFLYYAPDRVDQIGGGCLGGSFIGGRGEEHPSGQFGRYSPRAVRNVLGVRNAQADGTAPAWQLAAMVMNHYKRPKTFYVRTRIWYTTEPRTPLYLTTVGNCAQLAKGMSYDIPGGGAPGSTVTDRSTWTVPDGFNGRIIGAHSHHQGAPSTRRLRARAATARSSARRPTTARTITPTTRSARSCTSPGRSPTARSARRRGSR